jgi:hypothetical protein
MSTEVLRSAAHAVWNRLGEGGRALRMRADEPAAFPNRLLEAGPYRVRPAAASLTIALLVLAALLPRLWMAVRLPTVCVDGIGYIALAEGFEQQNSTSQSVFRFNLYPPILAALHYLGLSWDVAGRLWGVACASLLVPFLFGWVRRQFDDRVAVVACLLYAAHPELIELSPELIRDQTFWFFFTASLYFSWRAIVEVRLRYFAACAFVLPAAALARFEGIFLLLPPLLWSWARLRALREGRLRLAVGLVLALTLAPAALLTVNAVWLKRESPLRMLHLEPMKRLETLANQMFSADSPTPAAAGVEARPSPFSGAVVWHALSVCERGFTPFFGVLTLGALVYHGRRFLQSDHFATVLIAAFTAVGIWIHFWYCGEASARYVMAVVIMSSRCAAIGLMRLGDVAYRAAGTLPRWQAVRLLVPAILIAWTAVGWVDALTTNYRSRVFKADLGRWIQRQYGDDCRLVGADPQLALVTFYSHAQTVTLPPGLQADELPQFLGTGWPDVVVVAKNAVSNELYERLSHDHARFELQPISVPVQSSKRPEVLVFGRLSLRR